MADQPKLPKPSKPPPLGTYTAKVDDRGRLKLPADFKEFVQSFGDDRVFVTSMDLRTMQLYPVSLWLYNLEVGEKSSDQEAWESVITVANAYGSAAVMDDQGRVLLPQNTRRLLNLEDSTVYLDCYRNVVNIVPSGLAEERLQRAMADLEEKLKIVKKAGFQ